MSQDNQTDAAQPGADQPATDPAPAAAPAPQSLEDRVMAMELQIQKWEGIINRVTAFIGAV